MDGETDSVVEPTPARDWAAALCILGGGACLVAFGFLISPVVGLCILGVWLTLIGLALGMS